MQVLASLVRVQETAPGASQSKNRLPCVDASGQPEAGISQPWSHPPPCAV